MDDSFESENVEECRVCRCGPEENKPLFHPCLCRGSIACVHQECLEMWLDRVKKYHCEICSTEYIFDPEYAPNAPDVLPTSLILRSTLKLVSFDYLPRAIRGAFACFLWLVFLPLFTCAFTRKFIRHVTLSEMTQYYSSLTNVFQDIKIGVVSIGAAVLVFVILISFIDLFRAFRGGPEALEMRLANRRVRNRQRAHQEGDNQHININNIRQPNGGANDMMNDRMDDFESDDDAMDSDTSDDSDEDDHEDDLDDDDAAAANIEMRNRLLEGAGLQGPLHQLFMNIGVVCLFMGAVMTVFLIVPSALSYGGTPFLSLAPDFLRNFFLEIESASAKFNTVIRFSDLYHSFCTYRNIVLVVGLINKLGGDIINISSFMKIGVLLIHRIFFLPLSLGCCFHLVLNQVYGFSREQWVSYIAQNLVGSIAFAWTCGICYMLIVTVSVLQLREVGIALFFIRILCLISLVSQIFHPSILAKLVKPQESHAEMLQSMVSDSIFTHARRLLTSFAFYLVLFIVVVMCPIFLGCKFGLFANDLRLWYLLPELQIPFEIAVVHFTLLSALEKKKYLIGRFFYHWIGWLSTVFSISRAMIPYGMTVDRMNQPVRCDNGEIMDIKLRRPPKGWDARTNRETNNQVSTRWAWQDESKSSLENNLSPQIFPRFFTLRVIGFSLVLMFSLWFCVVAMMMFPVRLGRIVFELLCLPLWFQHDPLNFFIGFSLFYGLLSIPKKNYTAAVKSLSSLVYIIPLRTYRKLFVMSYKIILSQSSVNLCLMLLINPQILKTLSSFSLGAWMTLFSSYWFLFDVLIVLVILDFPIFLIKKLGLPIRLNDFQVWSRRLRKASSFLLRAILSLNLDTIDNCLTIIHDYLVNPIFEWTLFQSGFYKFVIAKVVFLLWLPSRKFEIISVIILLVDVGKSLYSIFLREPLNLLWSSIHQRVRDEQFLVGRRLRSLY